MNLLYYSPCPCRLVLWSLSSSPPCSCSQTSTNSRWSDPTHTSPSAFINSAVILQHLGALLFFMPLIADSISDRLCCSTLILGSDLASSAAASRSWKLMFGGGRVSNPLKYPVHLGNCSALSARSRPIIIIKWMYRCYCIRYTLY